MNINRFINFFSSIFNDKKKKVKKEVIQNEEERNIIEHLEDFKTRKVSEIMIPKANMVLIRDDINTNQLYQTFVKKYLTRIPVYKNTNDEIIGFVHIKDFLLHAHKINSKVDEDYDIIKKIIRKIMYTTKLTKCIDLFSKMRKDRINIAIVIDQHGSVEGLVTIESLIEEIVGEIKDEHDPQSEDALFKKIDNRIYIVDPTITIEEFEKIIKIDLCDLENFNDYETLSGFILSYLNRIPVKGELIKHTSGIVFKILEATEKKIVSIQVTLVD